MKVFVERLQENLVIVPAGVDVVGPLLVQSQQQSMAQMVVVGDQGVIADERNCGSKERDEPLCLLRPSNPASLGYSSPGKGKEYRTMCTIKANTLSSFDQRATVIATGN